MNQGKVTGYSRRMRSAFLAFAIVLGGGSGRAALREMSTDRPDATESPFTVDAGHWQIEMDLVSHTRNRLDGTRTREWEIAPFNLRFGVASNFELGIFISSYSQVRELPRNDLRTTSSGFGDVTLRAKLNFMGNGGNGAAFGVITDLKLPTASKAMGNGKVEGSLFLPFAIGLPAGWEFGAMSGVDLRNDDGRNVRGVWINTATIGHEIARNVSGYVELTSEAGEGSHVATFNCGIAWKLDADTQLDAGTNFGISRTAADLQIFAGVSRRF